MEKLYSRSGIAANSAKRLLRFLSSQKKTGDPYLILMHDYPDPDSIGSALGLGYLLDQLFGIPSRIAYRGAIGRMENKAMVDILKLPLYKLKPKDLRQYKNIALVDTQPQFENNPFPKNKQATLVIDQHPFVKKPDAKMSIINTQCGATCVILAQALLMIKTRIPTRVATSLVYGILSDTLNFFRTNQAEILKTYLALIPFCDLKALSRIQNPYRSRRTFVTLRKGISNAVVRKKLIVSHLGDIESPDLISQVADFLISYQRMSWCLCTGRNRGRLYVSFRVANRRNDAGEILRGIFDNPQDAGGHDFIAGGSFAVSGKLTHNRWTAIEKELVERLQKRLRISGSGDFYRPFR